MTLLLKAINKYFISQVPQVIEFLDILYEIDNTDEYVILKLIRKNGSSGIVGVNFEILINNVKIEYKSLTNISSILYLKFSH